MNKTIGAIHYSINIPSFFFFASVIVIMEEDALPQYVICRAHQYRQLPQRWMNVPLFASVC